jgi:anti-anti-sigma regulatory factor
MYSVETDDSNGLLKITWSGVVTVNEIQQCADQLRPLLAVMKPGFKVLGDLSGLQFMDPAGASYIAGIMDLLAAKQVGLIVRAIPDPRKDIGLNILSYFHYGPEVRVETYERLADALQRLSVGTESDKHPRPGR